MSEKYKKIITPEFRVSFPAVFQPRAFEGQEPKYSVVMLFDKATDLTALKKLAAEAVAAKWPDPTKRPKNLRNPFRDGDTEAPDKDGYQNTIFIRASSKTRPGLVDGNLQPIINEQEFYAGCYARAEITCYAYDTAGNRGVAFGLNHLQKLREGEPFSGRSRAEDVFAPAEEGASASAASVDSMWM